MRGTGYAQRSAGADINATRTVSLHRKLTVTPRAAFRKLYESHREVEVSSGTRTVIDAYTAFYDLGSNLRNLISGSLAKRWLEDAREQLEHRLIAATGSVLQDGGEPAPDFADHLEPEDWRELKQQFFLT